MSNQSQVCLYRSVTRSSRVTPLGQRQVQFQAKVACVKNLPWLEPIWSAQPTGHFRGALRYMLRIRLHYANALGTLPRVAVFQLGLRYGRSSDPSSARCLKVSSTVPWWSTPMPPALAGLRGRPRFSQREQLQG